VGRWGIAFALGALLGAAPALARADDKAAAGEAYDRGQRAFDAGRFREAAEEFRTADRLSPSAPALEAAIESGSRADDPGLVMELCEVADGRTGDAHLEGVARDARIRFEGRAARTIYKSAAANNKIEIDGHHLFSSINEFRTSRPGSAPVAFPFR